MSGDEKLRQQSGATRVIWLIVALAVGALYFWIIGIGAVNDRFVWNSGIDGHYGLREGPSVKGSDAVEGYYDLLGRAFARGQLHLPVEPAPGLLALPNPWSDRTNRPYRLLDAVLYNRHYYLYHGATPVLLVFAPWYLITRHDFPENFAAFLFAFGGYLFLSALFTRVAGTIRMPPLWCYAVLLAALGVSTSVPFVLHRAKVYEVAITCGYFCLSAGFYFLFRYLTNPSRPVFWAAASGVSLGLAAGCRPHLGVAAACSLLLLLLLPDPFVKIFRRIFRRDVLAFAVPVALCALGIAGYNYLRFNNPLEFGTRYLLGEDAYRNFSLSPSNVIYGFYYLLLCPPDWVAEFPFVRLALRQPFRMSPPGGYFQEAIGGIFSLCPMVLLIPALLSRRVRWAVSHRAFGLLLVMFATAVSSIFVIASVPFTSQRYEVDFLPYLLFIACVAASVLLGRWKGNLRVAAAAGVTIVLLYGVTANLALAVQGPYDQFVQSSPGDYVKLARWFSPVERFRPLWNPVFRVGGVFDFPAGCPAGPEPLVSAGEFGSRYLLAAECTGDGHLQLVSENSVRDPDVRRVALPDTPPGRYSAGLEFNPDDRTMAVSWNGAVVMRHPLRFLVTSKSQVHFGWDPSLGSREVFQGRIHGSAAVVAESGIGR